jgi:hypothetical protein
VDGSSAKLTASDELTEAYPPVENSHGATHFPILRSVCFEANDESHVRRVRCYAATPSAGLMGLDALTHESND